MDTNVCFLNRQKHSTTQKIHVSTTLEAHPSAQTKWKINWTMNITMISLLYPIISDDKPHY